MFVRLRSMGRVATAAVAGAMVLGVLQVIPTDPVMAGPSETGLITISPASPAAEPSGAATTYTVAVSCEGTAGTSCGGASPSTVTIPLTGTNTPAIAMNNWAYTATSGTSGLIASGPSVVSNGGGGWDLTMTLNNSIFQSGFSGTITLLVTPPDNTTPDHTTWSLTPSLSGGNITTATAPDPATGEATAEPLPVITKVTDDGGSVYLSGSDITYDITANCNAGGTGNLYLTTGSMSDPLPSYLAYVSSSPAGATYDAGSNTVTWTFLTAASTPSGCAQGATGATSYQIVAQAPPVAPPTGDQPLENVATFSGAGPDAENGTVAASTDAQVGVNIVDVPPTAPGTGYPGISKSSLAPLAIDTLPGNEYLGTYAGDWVTTSATPSYTVGAAGGSFQLSLGFPLTHTYQDQVVDPLPCLDNVTGDTYSSEGPDGAPCAAPAFHTQVIEVSGLGTGEAIANGWAPTATLTSNATVTLTPTGSIGSGATSAYYSIPGPDVTAVANINLPTTPYLTGNASTLTLWGYADASLSSPDILDNTATATPYLDGSPLTPGTASAKLYVLSSNVQLGVSKSFGGLGAGPGGTTVLNIEGAVSSPQALANNVVLSDLLPSGLSWNNVSSSGQFTVDEGSGAASAEVSATVAYTQDYEGTQRNLIQVTIPAADFAGYGSYTISPPNDFFELGTPSDVGTYANSDQIFLYGYAPTQIDPSCTTPTQTTGGTTPATLESYNPLNLAGDGNTQEDYCQNGATLVVEPTGAAFNLTKTVQGNLDSAPKGALGIGDASGDGTGTGTYTLTWTNVGSDVLDDPVVYDILPYIGDTGVSQGQANVDRGSQFEPLFAGVGTLPTNVEVYYSESSNPCRDQVYPNADNPSCANDWTTTEPSPASDVKALEFVDTTDPYSNNQGFSVSFTVDVPSGDVNEIAWNSAATNASDLSSPSTVPLPAEPPKVGLVAPTGPALDTATSKTSLSAYSTTEVSDVVSVTGTGGNSGTLDWSFVGPVAPSAGSCSGLDWTGAAAVAAGSITTPAEDGAVTVGPAEVQGQGCYSWVEDLTLDNSAGTATSSAGTSTEIVQANPYTPSLSTTADLTFSLVSGNSAHDSVTVSGSGIGTGNGAPSSATLTWQLYGPAAPVTAGTCSGVDWSSASELDSGSASVTGDGTYTLTATALTITGCYSYTDQLPETSAGNSASTPAGTASETFILLPPPTLTTTAQQAEPYPRTAVSDRVTLSGTYGYSGTIAWSLYGPVTVPVSGNCSAVTATQWSDATSTQITAGDPSGTATAPSGTRAFTGDGNVTVPGGTTDIGPQGCYSWAETAYGPNFVGTTVLAAGAANEIFQVVPYQPSISTSAVPVWNGTNNVASDTVVVSNSDLGGGNDAPKATLDWYLYGPVPNPGGGCDNVSALSWSSAALVNSGTAPVSEGSNSVGVTTLAAIGCYTYTNSLGATTDTDAVALSSPGPASETFEIISSQQITTFSNQTDPDPRTTVSDNVTISGTNGYSGTLDWQLLGPLNPVPAGGCGALTATAWTGASTFASGSVAIGGDVPGMTVPSGGVTAGAPGCYGWAEQLTGNHYLGTTSSPATSPNEAFQVLVLQPTVTSTLQPSVSAGAESAYDSIEVSGTDIQPGNSTGAPTSGTLTWELDGPVTTPSSGCAAVTSSDWTAAPVAASGTITLTGNASYNTPATNDLALDSCYSYTETVAATSDSATAGIAAGENAETVAVPPAPEVTTQATPTSPSPRTTASDSVTIAGTNGGNGELSWELLGPLTVPNGGCGAVTTGQWTASPVYRSGDVAVSGDQTGLSVPTGGVTLGAPGCYSWADTVAGSTFPGTTTVNAGAANEYFDVQPLYPSLNTTVVPSVNGGNEQVSDSIVVSGTDISPGNVTGAPTSDTLTWDLYGPVSPPTGGCGDVTSLQWQSAPLAGSGTITLTGNATYTTPLSSDLTLNSCYSYSDAMPSTTDSVPVMVAAGVSTETADVPPPPTLSTYTASAAYPGSSVSDSVTVSGMNPYSGTLTWALIGPVAAPSGSCDAVNWADAPATPVGQGSVAVSADGTVSVGPVEVATTGCYSWTESLSGTFPGSTAVGAGAASEVVNVEDELAQPRLATVAVLSSAAGGSKSVIDTVSISGSGIGTGPREVPSTTLTWELLGPEPAQSASCSAVSWTSAPAWATGTVTVLGDGNYTTPPTPLTEPGCYAYSEQLALDANAKSASAAPGAAGETVLLLAPPAVTTTASEASVNPHSPVFDTVSVAASGGDAGTLDWSLVGPVLPGGGGTCDTATWARAPVVASGDVALSGGTRVITGPVAVKGLGCYSWADDLSGPAWVGETTVAPGAAGEVVVVDPYQPMLTTVAALSAQADVSDSITVSGEAGLAGAAVSTLDWQLYGPAGHNGADCGRVQWDGQPSVARGKITVAGDGTYQTAPTKLREPGCYSYSATLPGSGDTASASSAAGIAVETVYLALTPAATVASTTTLPMTTTTTGRPTTTAPPAPTRPTTTTLPPTTTTTATPPPPTTKAPTTLPPTTEASTATSRPRGAQHKPHSSGSGQSGGALTTTTEAVPRRLKQKPTPTKPSTTTTMTAPTTVPTTTKPLATRPATTTPPTTKLTPTTSTRRRAGGGGGQRSTATTSAPSRTAPTTTTPPGRTASTATGSSSARGTATTTTVPNGLGRIGTDLGRWSPGASLLPPFLVGSGLLALATAFVLLCTGERRRRRTWDRRA